MQAVRIRSVSISLLSLFLLRLKPDRHATTHLLRIFLPENLSLPSLAVRAKPGFIKPLSSFSGFRTVARSGQVIGNSLPLGTLIDFKGKPLPARTSRSCKNQTCTTVTPNATKYEVSHNPDYTAFYTKPNGATYMITQFESPNPASAYVVKIEINANWKDGACLGQAS